MEVNPYDSPKEARCESLERDGAVLIVDVARRVELAEGTQEYLAGMLTNYEFERRLQATDLPMFRQPRPEDDSVLSPMMQRLWNFCYVHGDLDEYRLTNEYRLPMKIRREVLRWVLFLRSDHHYEWPQLQWGPDGIFVDIGHSLLSLLTLGYWRKRQRLIADREFQQFKFAGDYDVWPFIRRSDYEATLASFCPLYPRT